MDPPEEVRRGQVGTLGDPENPVHLSRPGHRCTRGAAGDPPTDVPYALGSLEKCPALGEVALTPLALGDVVQDRGLPDDRAVRGEDRRQAHRHLEIRAIAPCPRRLVMAQTLPGCHPGEDLREVLASFFIEDLAIKAPNHLSGAVVVEALGGSVPARHAPVHLDAHDGVLSAFHDRGEQRSSLLRALPIGDVVSDPQRADDEPVRGLNR